VNIRNAISKYAAALKSITPGEPLDLPLMPASAEALTILALSKARSHSVLWIHDNTEALEQAHRTLATLSSNETITYFPPQDAPPGEEKGDDPELTGYRTRALLQLQDAKPNTIITTCIQALLQPLPLPHELNAETIQIEVDGDLDLDTVALKLLSTGYTHESEVVEKGQIARRGGLMDVWPPASTWPIRIELFGNTVESIRLFDIATQRSIEKCPAATLPPAKEAIDHPSEWGTLLDYIPEPATIVWSEPGSIAHHAELYEAQAQNRVTHMPPHRLTEIQELIRAHKGLDEIRINPDDPVQQSPALPQFLAVDTILKTDTSDHNTDPTAQARTALINKLYTLARRRHHISLFFDTKGALDHFNETLAQHDSKPLHTEIGTLSDGCECSSLRLAIVAESNLYGRRKTLRRRYDPDALIKRPKQYRGARITDFTDMDVGDLVVHIDHGIGRYVGVQEITFNDQQQEVLAIEYADQAKLYVPMSHANLLSRYVGLASQKTRLHKLGGARWGRDKTQAQKAVLDLAAGLLDVQAARNLLQGHSYPTDTTWQLEFENAFPFQETEDQIHTIRDVKADMESTRPMDRLICGDAGYGKTEVAMRAAFKAVEDGRQVAMLVPTTILAQQHFRTFTERMAEFPMRIEVLSRFCTQSKHNSILQALRDGTVDIVIGTHALVQPGVAFANLGLVIIDEEQRFGVHHKEFLKTLKQLVDVLTLSATPIPRTLYMSMTGARDMSLLQTPPRERMAIETRVATADDDVVRDAVLRELRRDGQIYYLHNRVMTIQRLRDRLERLIPEARIEVAHGQMKSSELARVMKAFSAGEFDVLLCTTIIESGMDIPRANTIFIDRADRFGIADLYQLRGRVGRSRHKAYAYLLLPPHGHIDSDARERIRALRKHSGLGTGFNLAIRDMEIRGAGNILGAAQSGHISAVGFGLYCQLLKQSIARLKGEAPAAIVDTELRLDFIQLTPTPSEAYGAAYLPMHYIPDERIRVAVYRRIAEATDSKDIEGLQQELEDRFGKLPPVVTRLLAVATIRIQAAHLKIDLVEVKQRKIIIKRKGHYLRTGSRFDTLETDDPDDRLLELQDYILNC
jgi:transcription-repair coupling factor (superfamily II helicase)